MNNRKILFTIIFMLFLIYPVFAINEPTNLQQTSTTDTTITWQWVSNSTWYNTSIWLNGVFKTNLTVNGTQTYSSSGLTPKTSYTLRIYSYNATGELTSTWVNNTVVTLTSTGYSFQALTDLINATVTILGTFNSSSNTLVNFIVLMGELSLIGIIIFGFVFVFLKRMGNKLS